MDIGTLSAPELVTFAESKGLSREIVGMNAGQVRDFLAKELEESVKEEIIVEEPGALSWQDLKILAKEKGINTYKKKRVEVELLLKGEEIKENEYPNLISEEAVEKAVENGDLVVRSEGEKVDDSKLLFDLVIKVGNLEQRINRIVDAIDKSKRIKGM